MKCVGGKERVQVGEGKGVVERCGMGVEGKGDGEVYGRDGRVHIKGKGIV